MVVVVVKAEKNQLRPNDRHRDDDQKEDFTSPKRKRERG